MSLYPNHYARQKFATGKQSHRIKTLLINPSQKHSQSMHSISAPLESHQSSRLSRTIRLVELSFVEKATNLIAFTPLSNHHREVTGVQTQQTAIIRDALMGLVGYEGYYVRFSDKYNPELLHDRIHGPDHKIAKHLDVSLKAVTKKLLRYGKYFSGLKMFAEIYNQPRFGRVNQRLCCEIASFLRVYQQAVCKFEEAFKFNTNFTLNQMNNEITQILADKITHLYDIIIAIHTESEERNNGLRDATSLDLLASTSSRAANFDTFLKTIKKDLHLAGSIDVSTDTNNFEVCKGGLVLRIIQRRINQFAGDAVSSQFLSQVFEAVSKDYVALLNLWLSKGEVDDPFDEFFIKENELPSNIFYSNVEKYWDELYVVKIDGIIDLFTNKDLQLKVLATGKYLSILKQSTGAASLDHIFDSLSGTLIPYPIESLYAPDVPLKILQFYKRANNLMLKLLFEGYEFSSLMENIHETFLLNNSYNIDKFLDKSFHDLARNKYHTSITKTIKSYNQIFLLDKRKINFVDITKEENEDSASIQDVLNVCEKFNIDSTSFYEMAQDIIGIRSIDTNEEAKGTENASSAIKRLVSKSLKRRQISLSEKNIQNPTSSIDNFAITGVNVDLNLPFPLSLIVGENFIFEYQLLFKLQMIIKFASKSMDESWKDINFSTVWKYKGFSAPIKKLILRCRTLNSRMKNFVNEIQNYINYSVTEPNYVTLMKTLKNIDASTKVGNYVPPANQRLESVQLLKRHRHKNNNVFDEKILASGFHQPSHGAVKNEKNSDVFEMIQTIGTYLNNILREAMVTNEKLLSCIKVLFDCVIHFTITVSRLKKALILMNQYLLQSFAMDFPDKFGDIEFSDSLAESRIAGLNEVLTKHWRKFNNALALFIDELKEVATENLVLVHLIERMQVI